MERLACQLEEWKFGEKLKEKMIFELAYKNTRKEKRLYDILLLQTLLAYLLRLMEVKHLVKVKSTKVPEVPE